MTRYSVKKNPNDYQNIQYGITQSNYYQGHQQLSQPDSSLLNQKEQEEMRKFVVEHLKRVTIQES